MLLVMSLRTTPSIANTSGPFDPSPGNGPAVSSGIFVQLLVVAVVVSVAAPVEPLVDGVVGGVVAALDDDFELDPHAASTTMPAAPPPRSFKR
jgi:hypothetical protein